MIPLEYIGPVPQKKKTNYGGGVIIVSLVLLFVFFFTRSIYAEYLNRGKDQPSQETAFLTVKQLYQKGGKANLLAAEALKLTLNETIYDDKYYKISFPMGDVPKTRGNRADVLVRAYRSLGIDLQQILNQDMRSNFRVYPQLWGAKEVDTNIDHRRVPNLHRFFSRKGEEMQVIRKSYSYSIGDVVFWRLPEGDEHAGIVVPGPGLRFKEKWVVHNNGVKIVWDKALLDFKILGHYKYALAE